MFSDVVDCQGLKDWFALASTVNLPHYRSQHAGVRSLEACGRFGVCSPQGAPSYIYNGERNPHTDKHGRVVYYEPLLKRPTATGSAYRYGTHTRYRHYD